MRCGNQGRILRKLTDLHDEIESRFKRSRSVSCALTKIDECYMWLERAVFEELIMDFKPVEDQWCASCRFSKPGLRSDCPIKLALKYNDTKSMARGYADHQIANGTCRQWEAK